jgi:hypothetical protein
MIDAMACSGSNRSMPRTDRIGPGGRVTGLRTTWPSLWRRNMANENRRISRPRINLPTSWTAKKTQIIGNNWTYPLFSLRAAAVSGAKAYGGIVKEVVGGPTPIFRITIPTPK